MNDTTFLARNIQDLTYLQMQELASWIAQDFLIDGGGRSISDEGSLDVDDVAQRLISWADETLNPALVTDADCGAEDD